MIKRVDLIYKEVKKEQLPTFHPLQPRHIKTYYIKNKRGHKTDYIEAVN